MRQLLRRTTTTTANERMEKKKHVRQLSPPCVFDIKRRREKKIRKRKRDLDKEKRKKELNNKVKKKENRSFMQKLIIPLEISVFLFFSDFLCAFQLSFFLFAWGSGTPRATDTAVPRGDVRRNSPARRCMCVGVFERCSFLFFTAHSHTPGLSRQSTADLQKKKREGGKDEREKDGKREKRDDVPLRFGRAKKHV